MLIQDFSSVLMSCLKVGLQKKQTVSLSFSVAARCRLLEKQPQTFFSLFVMVLKEVCRLACWHCLYCKSAPIEVINNLGHAAVYVSILHNIYPIVSRNLSQLHDIQIKAVVSS